MQWLNNALTYTVGKDGYFFRDKQHAQETWKDINPETFDLNHFNAFTGGTRLFWTSIFMRYLIQPQQWFSDAIKEISLNSLVTGKIKNNSGNEIMNTDENKLKLEVNVIYVYPSISML